MFSIAVVGDVHLDRRNAPESWDVAQAVFRRAGRADAVVVVGDLFDSAGAMRRDRGAVERLLRANGIWRPERLAVIVGNHDVFEIGHRGGALARVIGAARGLRAGAERNLETFSDWIGELVPKRDRRFSNAIFPYRRRLGPVTLVAADSTASTTLESGQGSWTKEEDDGVRALLERTRGVRLLATHHPPVPSEGLLSVRERLAGFVDGLPSGDFSRLEALLLEAEIDLVAAGHFHEGSRWSIGRTRVFVEGRSGGLGEGGPRIGTLSLTRDRIRWSTSAVAAGG